MKENNKKIFSIDRLPIPKRCDYLSCNCIIPTGGHQVVRRRNHKRLFFCDKWCAEQGTLGILKENKVKLCPICNTIIDSYIGKDGEPTGMYPKYCVEHKGTRLAYKKRILSTEYVLKKYTCKTCNVLKNRNEFYLSGKRKTANCKVCIRAMKNKKYPTQSVKLRALSKSNYYKLKAKKALINKDSLGYC